jgi:hypothetical protein
VNNAKLTLDDIADLRAYERERADFKARVVEMKKKRRIHVGPIVTLLFENRDTMRLQIQEMARVEKIFTDEGIQAELDTYNPLIPDPGHLSATLFVELTSDEQLREWLPKLVGIETKVELRIGSGADRTVVRCTVDPEHEAQLTRDEITASVHYVAFSLSDEEIDAFAAGPVSLAVAHPAYDHETELSTESLEELLHDLRGA